MTVHGPLAKVTDWTIFFLDPDGSATLAFRLAWTIRVAAAAPGTARSEPPIIASVIVVTTE